MRTGGLVVASIVVGCAVGCGTRTGLLSAGVDGALDDDVGGGGSDAGTTPDGSIPLCGSEPNACEADGGMLDAHARLRSVLMRCKPGVRCDWVTAHFDDAGCLSETSVSGLTPEEERCVIAGTAGARHLCLRRESMVAQGACP